MTTKICTKCNLEKDIKQFYKAKYGKYGCRAECKECAEYLAKQRRSKRSKVGKIYIEIIGSIIKNIKILDIIEDKSYDPTNPAYHCICSICKKSNIYRYRNIIRKTFKGCYCRKLDTYKVQNYIYYTYKLSAKKRNKNFELSLEEFIDICEKPCFYCGIEKEKSNLCRPSRLEAEWRYNGIDRVDNSRGYTLDNIVPCCKLCNKMKMALDYNEFIDHIYKIRDHLESKKCQNTT